MCLCRLNGLNEVDPTLFYYSLPASRIAQRPAGLNASRSSSKLLYARLDASGGFSITDHVFNDLPVLLRAGDLLVLNNTKVIPCRFFARHPESGAKIEVLLVRRTRGEGGHGADCWEALARPMRKLKAGDTLQLSAHLLADVLGRTPDGKRMLVRLLAVGAERPVGDLITDEGGMPIPPYIRAGHADQLDQQLYQTVYAQTAGSVAAPTAGLHFTEQLLGVLAAQGISCCFLTLHVGPASFLPVASDELSSHDMLAEEYAIPLDTRRMIQEAKGQGRRVIAVGTTTVRALESAALADPGFCLAEADNEARCDAQVEAPCDTQLLIRPGFKFSVVDALITNFHQPGSTHLLLVAAFAGEKQTEDIYRRALAGDYRFLSYGDAMLLEPEKQVNHGGVGHR